MALNIVLRQSKRKSLPRCLIFLKKNCANWSQTYPNNSQIDNAMKNNKSPPYRY